MPNSIRSDQNDRHLIHFVASRVWYKRGRRTAFLQAFFAFGVPIASAIVLLSGFAAWKVWTSTIGISVAILDTIFLDRLQRQLRLNGANEQEVFDCHVLGIEWPIGIAGSAPTTTRTNDAVKGCDFTLYRNWYPDVTPIPRWMGALICQQCNSWWDAKIRKRYVIGLGIALAVVSIALVTLGFQHKLTFEQSVLMIYAPISPMLMWTIREFLRHHETTLLSERTEKLADSTWKSALVGGIADPQAVTRELQDALYYRRRTSPFIPTFLQKIQRRSYLETMHRTAAEMVKQALETLQKQPDIYNPDYAEDFPAPGRPRPE